jgi:hypothetical protein
MLEQIEQLEFDVIPPHHPLRITLDVSPQELEMALATSGSSLCRALMMAIVAAMVVDIGPDVLN